MPLTTGVVMARRRVRRFMKTPIVITRGAATIYAGGCSYRSAEANQGQAAHPDAVEANQKALHTYDVWIPYDAPTILESDIALIDGALTLSVIALEAEATDKTAVQLRCARHRLATPFDVFTFVRIDGVTGVETSYGPYDGQVVIEGPTPIGQGEVVLGGSNFYLQGSVFLTNLSANVMGGDRFKYDGRFGEVLGLPAPSNDRLQVKMRLPDGGASNG